jgi:acetyl esterase/lipase
MGDNPGLAVRLVVGATDPLLAENRAFADARRAAGLPVSLVAASDTGGQSMLSPRTAEGRITVRETLAAVGLKY